MKMQTKVERLAMNDAYDWKMTQVLIPDIQWKVERISGYLDAFNKAGEKLDMAQEEKFLAQARKRLEKKGFTGEKVSKKGRNIKIVLIVAGTVYVLHEMGYLEKVKVKYRRAQLWTVAMQDPESETYKNFIDDVTNKFAAMIDPDGDPSNYQRYKNKRTVVGETVEDTPEQEPAKESDEPKQSPSQES